MNNTVTSEIVFSKIEKEEYFNPTGKTTIGVFTLTNGFVIVESSSCVDPKNYDEEIGKSICRERAVSKIWELEGYVLQTRIAEE